jgi:DNA-binding transcriptional MerR regulator
MDFDAGRKHQANEYERPPVCIHRDCFVATPDCHWALSAGPLARKKKTDSPLALLDHARAGWGRRHAHLAEWLIANVNPAHPLRYPAPIITFMRIKELAINAGVNIQSIRFYERQGLLREPPRTASGYRNYNQSDAERIAFIKWCQPLGFTLKEVSELIQLHAALANLSSPHSAPGPKQLQRIICMSQQKSSDIQNRIKLLKSAVKQLAFAIKKLQSKPGPSCPALPSFTRSKMLPPSRVVAPGKPNRKRMLKFPTSSVQK